MKKQSEEKQESSQDDQVFAFRVNSNRPVPAKTIRTDHMPQHIRAFAWIAGLSRHVGMGVRP